MNSGTVLDFIFAAIILVCAIIAVIKGFVREIFEKGVPVISIWMSILFYQKVSVLFEKSIKNHFACVILAFLAVFVLVFLLLKLVQLLFQKLFETSLLNSLDHFLGFVFGLLEGLAITCLVLLIFNVQPWFDLSLMLSQSFFFKILSSFINKPLSLPLEQSQKILDSITISIFNGGWVNV